MNVQTLAGKYIEADDELQVATEAAEDEMRLRCEVEASKREAALAKLSPQQRTALQDLQTKTSLQLEAETGRNAATQPQ